MQYAAFGGWQLAANALYGYAYALQEDSISIPWEYKELQALVNQHIDSLRHLANRPDKEIGVYYLWDFKSPLRVYMNKKLHRNKDLPFFTKWATMAPLYAAYGRWLIANHPGPFIRHFVWPNLVRFYSPPAFFMEKYNLGNKRVDPVVVAWFHWANDQLPTRAKDRNIDLMGVFPNLLAIINPVFLISSLLLLGSKRFRQYSTTSKRVVGCMIAVWLCNAFFSVFSAPIELRYQIFPVIITLFFGLLFISQAFQYILEGSPTKPEQAIPVTEPHYDLTKA